MSWTPVLALARTTTSEILRQPFHAVIALATLFAYALSPSIAMFSFGEDLRLLKDFGVSTLLLSGTILAASAASTVVGRELVTGSADVFLSKPLGRGAFLLGKILGIAAAVGATSLVYVVALLLATRLGPPQHAREVPDWPALGAGLGAFGVTLTAALARSLKSPPDFSRAAFRAAFISFPLGLALPFLFQKDGHLAPGIAWIDSVVLLASLLAIAGALLVCAVAAMLGVLLGRGAAAATCAVFALGLVLGKAPGVRWLLPDLQVFWAGEAFFREPATLTLGYLLGALGYAMAYGAACWAVGAARLEARDRR